MSGHCVGTESCCANALVEFDGQVAVVTGAGRGLAISGKPARYGPVRVSAR
jgi:hypothetical protein